MKRTTAVLTMLAAAFACLPAPAGAASLLPPQTLSTADAGVAGYDAVNGAAVADGAGNLTVIWEQHYNNTKPAEVLVRRRARGTDFTAPLALSNVADVGTLPSGGFDAAQSIAVDASGTVTVAYTEQSGATWGVWARTAPAGGAFSAPVNITPMSATLTGVEAVIAAPGGGVAVLYTLGGKLTARVRPAGAAAFGSATTIDATTGGNSYSMGADAAGQMTVVYRNGFPGQLYVSTAPPGGAFPASTLMTPPSAVDSAMAVEPGGRTSVVYRDNSDDLHVLVRPAGSSAFAAPADLTLTSTVSPVVLLGEDGTLTVAGRTSGGYVLRARPAATATFGAAEAIAGATYDSPWGGAVDGSGQRVFLLTGPAPAGMHQIGITGRGAADAAFSVPSPYLGPTTLTSSDLRLTGVGSDAVLITSSRRESAALSQTFAAAFYDGTAPDVRAFVVPGTAVAGAAVSMSADAFDGVSGGAVTLHWAFGDGTAADGAAVTHAWAAPGTYAVTLTATDQAGNVATRSANVVVGALSLGPPASAAGARSRIAKPGRTRAHRALTLHGSASAPAGIRRVQIALTRATRGHCQWRTAAGKLRSRRGTCPTVWITARGTAAWSLKLRAGLPRGTWVVRSRATDSAGRPERSFTAKLGNRRALSVK